MRPGFVLFALAVISSSFATAALAAPHRLIAESPSWVAHWHARVPRPDSSDLASIHDQTAETPVGDASAASALTSRQAAGTAADAGTANANANNVYSYPPIISSNPSPGQAAGIAVGSVGSGTAGTSAGSTSSGLSGGQVAGIAAGSGVALAGAGAAGIALATAGPAGSGVALAGADAAELAPATAPAAPPFKQGQSLQDVVDQFSGENWAHASTHISEVTKAKNWAHALGYSAQPATEASPAKLFAEGDALTAPGESLLNDLVRSGAIKL